MNDDLDDAPDDTDVDYPLGPEVEPDEVDDVDVPGDPDDEDDEEGGQ